MKIKTESLEEITITRKNLLRLYNCNDKMYNRLADTKIFFINSDLIMMGKAFLKKGSFSIKPVFKSHFCCIFKFENTT